MKSTLENENNSSNKITDNKIITNEIAIMLEESNFLENLILLMVRIILLIFFIVRWEIHVDEELHRKRNFSQELTITITALQRWYQPIFQKLRGDNDSKKLLD